MSKSADNEAKALINFFVIIQYQGHRHSKMCLSICGWNEEKVGNGSGKVHAFYIFVYSIR